MANIVLLSKTWNKFRKPGGSFSKTFGNHVGSKNKVFYSCYLLKVMIYEFVYKTMFISIKNSFN